MSSVANEFVQRDAFNLLCGELIGSGIARQVFTCPLHPDCVVKVESTAGSFQNIMEYEFWQRIQHTDHAKWFAPCKWISPSGSVLIQVRTEIAQQNQYPEMMPVFLTDFKRTNYGMLNGQLVCHDYGTCLLPEYGMTKRMKKAGWWNLGD